MGRLTLTNELEPGSVGGGWTSEATPVLRKAHWAIDKVTRDLERFSFNTAVAAVMELLAHTSGGVLRLFPAVPSAWREASFEGIRVEGGFLVSATLAAGHVTEVRVKAESAGSLRLRNPFGGPARLSRDGAILTGETLELRLVSGEELILTPAVA